MIMVVSAKLTDLPANDSYPADLIPISLLCPGFKQIFQVNDYQFILIKLCIDLATYHFTFWYFTGVGF